MSSSDLRKMATEWLDLNDKKTSELGLKDKSFKSSSSSVMPGSEWEDIRISSGEVTPTLPMDTTSPSRCIPSIANRFDCHTTPAVMPGPAQSNAKSRGIEFHVCGLTYNLFAPVTFAELGSGAVVGTEVLLATRLFSVFSIGLSAWFSYSMMDKISARILLAELFMWLPLFTLVLMLMLGAASCHTLMRRGIAEKNMEERAQSKWLVVDILFQIAVTLAQMEVAKLIFMHTVKSLRPFTQSNDIERIYSLDGPLACQRYLIMFSTTLDVVLSTAPLRGENMVLASVVFIVWTSVSLFSRPTVSTAAAKVRFLVCNVVLLVALSAFSIFMRRAVSWCAQSQQQQAIDKPIDLGAI